MPNNPLTLAELSAYTSTFPYPQIPAGYFFASPPLGAGPLAYRLFDAKYITIGTIDPDRLGTGATGAGNLYLADDGTWKTISVGGGGDMLRATYDVDNDGVVDSAERTEIIVRNSTGATLTKGQIVYLSGATGNRPNAVLSQAHTEATSSKTIGIVVANINNNSDGYVATNGTLHDLNTSAFADGAAVWLSATTAGGMTSTVPAEPNHAVFIGYIARSHPTAGRIVLHIQNGYEFDELHGVLLNSPANNDLVVYETSSTLWKNKSISTIFGGTPLVSVPTLAQVTTAGNTTNNSIGLGVASAPTYRLEVAGTTNAHAVRSHIGYDVYPVPDPTSLSGVISAGGSVDTGLHGYYLSFYTALGETHGFGPVSITTTAGNNTVTLTIPTSSDPRVIGRKLYRTKVGSAFNEYLLATITDNTATSYVDTAADSTLTTNYRGVYYRANTTANFLTIDGTRFMIADINATYFGIGAGRFVTSGGYNSFLGSYTGGSTTTGASNIFVGYLTGYFNTTGDANTVMGTTAYYAVTNGSNNVVIGFNAGRYIADNSTQVTSVNNGIYIGFRANVSATTGVTNEMVFGNQVTGLGSNTVVLGNDSIVRTALKGNVLIGTTTDSGYRLNVNGTTRFIGDSYVSSGDLLLDNDRPIRWKDSGGTFRRTALISAANDLQFGHIDTGWGGQTYIKAGGVIVLLVNGASGTSTTALYAASNGNIGIGTSSPNYKIDVQGTALSTSSVRVQGSFDINPLAAPPVIGGFTLSAGTNLGVGTYYYFVTYVTAIGETSAGANLTVTTTTGNTTVNLTGIPVSSDPRVTARKIYRTLLNQTIDAHRFLVTINDNITTTYTDSATDASLTGLALQYYKVNTTARYFTVSGVQGMVIDQNLTALGRNAGNAIIASSGAAIRTVLIGAQAGQNITTGQANVIVGVAGASLTTGNNNTLVGDLAGYGLTIGYENTFFGGDGVGRFVTTGYRNTFIGNQAGRNLNNGTTQFTVGFENIAIGNRARMFANNDSNSIVIGNVALGLGSNTTVIGNSSITFTSIPAGNLGVGTTTNAGFKLDVNGTARVQGAISSTALTTDGPVVSTAGVLGSVAGYTGMVTIQQPSPLPPINFDIQNGIIVNVL